MKGYCLQYHVNIKLLNELLVHYSMLNLIFSNILLVMFEYHYLYKNGILL